MKFAIIGAALAALVLGAWLVFESGKRVGEAERDAAAALALKDWHKRETELLAELNKPDKAAEVIYRDRIKIIQQASDDCLDRALPADIITGVQ